MRGQFHAKRRGLFTRNIQVTNPTDQSGYATSALNVTSKDGFNTVAYYFPDYSVTYNNYKNLVTLGKANHGLKIMDEMNYWYRPTVPSGYTHCNLPARQTLHSGTNQYNDGPSASDPVNNPVNWNYDAVYTNVYNDPLIAPYLYCHDLGGEMTFFHLYPKYASTPPSSMGSAWCDEFVYPDPTKICDGCNTGTTQNWFHSEVPPQNLSDAILHFQSLDPNQKLSSSIATHNNSIQNMDINNLGEWHTAPYNGIYFVRQHLTFRGVTNARKPDIIKECSYYNTAFARWTYSDSYVNDYVNSPRNYLGKLANIDYIHDSGYAKIISENDVAIEDIHELHSNPNIQNANMLRFLTYASIIHGVDGINFYNAPEYAGSGNTQFDPTGQDQARYTRISQYNTTTNPNPYVRANFPFVYQAYVSKLAREVRYLVNKNLIAPFSTPPTGYTVVSRKLSSTLSSNQVTALPTGTPSTLSYLPATITGADAQDLTAIVTNNPTSFTNNHRGEYYGIRYLITTNGTEAIMIAVNPNPYSIHNVNFDFNNKTFSSSSFNTLLSNTKAIDVLFEDGSVTNVTSLSYKTDTSSSVSEGTFSSQSDNVGNFTLLKKYTIPFCSSNKTFTSDFGPFDAKIFYFNSAYSGLNAFNTNGWAKQWSNNGDGTIGGLWGGPGNLQSTDKFIPIDFNGDGDEELLCVQSINSGGPTSPPNAWASVLNWNGSGWTLMWSNYGNGCFNGGATSGQYGFTGWGVRAADKYLVGDFDKDGKKNDLLCIQGDGGCAMVLHSNGSNFTQIWYNNCSGIYGGWGLHNLDKFQVGDFDHDNFENDLLSVQGDAANHWWSIHRFIPGSGFTWWCGDGNGWLQDVGLNNSSTYWTIAAGDQYVVGDYNGDGYRDEILCMERTLGNKNAIICSYGANGPAAVEWSDISSPGNVGGWGAPVNPSDKVVVGNIDGDPKEEVMFLQNCSTCGYATSENLSTGNPGSMMWHWSNHNTSTVFWPNTTPSNTSLMYANPQQNYVGDWQLNDPYASDVKYLFIRPNVGGTKSLLAFKNNPCNRYLISMYTTNWTGADYRSSSAQTSVNEDISNYSSFTLFPNPSNGSFTIRSNNDQEKWIIVSDVLGKSVYSGLLTGTELTIKLPDDMKGIFFVKVAQEQKTEIKKIIIVE